MSKLFSITEEKINLGRSSQIKRIYINNTLVCECKVGSDYFCSIDRGGHPSNIRNKVKKTYTTSWRISNIRAIIGDLFDRNDFKDSYPDLIWGDQGSIITMKKVKEIFTKYINS